MPEQPPSAGPPQSPPAGGPPEQQPSGRPSRLKATALGYEPGSNAPRVLAAGVGLIAEQLVRAAHASGVPVTADPALAEALSSLELGSEIPSELYAAAAETLAWAYRLDAQARESTLRRPE
ncbi:MAG TPA: EscU/YscU/HrcU family type III secretion system export apparatus switch protein [Solirubrobacteraceae bacterium]|nr:EscU/YscU/HrcU family type III secretion system export apparatus switch protein [Solirubrobacteraceae bacterium]